MSQFSRRARWLNIFFPQSVAPQVTDPSSVTDDVSLVQPYDGGGYGFAEDVFEDFVDVTQAIAGGSGSYLLLQVPEGRICRLLAGDTKSIAGVPPTSGGLTVEQNSGTATQVGISSDQATILVAFSVWQVFAPVLGPNVDIRFRFQGGDAANITRTRLYFKLAPLGTVFRV